MTAHCGVRRRFDQLNRCYELRVMKMIAFAIFVLLFDVSLCADTVKYAAVIFRHGDRTPVGTYPTDPWRNESLWPVRFGELTNIGKRQHYALGQWLRKRYSVSTSSYLKMPPIELNKLFLTWQVSLKSTSGTFLSQMVWTNTKLLFYILKRKWIWIILNKLELSCLNLTTILSEILPIIVLTEL